MHYLSLLALGALIGTLIGLSGIGSGSLVTPLLILAAGMSPVTAVGTSLAFSFGTKLFGSWSFHRRALIRWDVVTQFAVGVVPGALSGAVFIRYVGAHRPEYLDSFLLRAIGVILILLSAVIVVRLLPTAVRPGNLRRFIPRAGWSRKVMLLMAGLAIGLTVATTSIGSGAILVGVVVLFYELDSGSLVGSCVILGALMTAISGLPYVALGVVDWKAAAVMVLASVPAMQFVVRLHGRLPRAISESVVAAALMAIGVRILAF